MSRARHHGKKMRASGGRTVAYSGGDSNVMKEAHERKRGGRVHHEAEGEESKSRADKRARGGKVKAHPKHHSDGGIAHHEKMHERKRGGRVHHGKRERGGAVGADKRPLSSAAHIKELGGELPREGE